MQYPSEPNTMDPDTNSGPDPVQPNIPGRYAGYKQKSKYTRKKGKRKKK